MCINKDWHDGDGKRECLKITSAPCAVIDHYVCCVFAGVDGESAAARSSRHSTATHCSQARRHVYTQGQGAATV
jgi:hypothetical protein